MRTRGLSLAEVILSMGILAIVSLGVIACLTRMMTAQSTSSRQTMARILADSVLSKAAIEGKTAWADPSQVRKLESRSGQEAALLEYSYKLTATEVSAVSAHLGLEDSGGPEMGELWQLELNIWWESDEAQGAVEKGRRELTVTKMVYLEN